MPTTWTCTDPDSYQWLGTVDGKAYDAIDTIWFDNGDVAVTTAFIDPDLYDDEDRREACWYFGYEVGEVDDALMAEILFETYELYEPSNVVGYHDNPKDAMSHIDRLIDRISEANLARQEMA